MRADATITVFKAEKVLETYKEKCGIIEEVIENGRNLVKRYAFDLITLR